MSIDTKLQTALNRLSLLTNKDKFGDIIQKLRGDADVCLAAPVVPAFTVGAESTNAIAVSVQFNDGAGNALAKAVPFTYVIADTANGIPTGTPPDGATAQTTGTVDKVDTAKVYARGRSTTAGLAVITLTESTAKSFYLIIEVQGRCYSQIVTFA